MSDTTKHTSPDLPVPDTDVYLKTGTHCLYCDTQLSDCIPYSALPGLEGRDSMSSSRRMVIIHHGGSYHKVRIGRVIKNPNGLYVKQRLEDLYPSQKQVIQ